MNWQCAAVSLLLFPVAQRAGAQPALLTRGPYIVDATTVSAKVCWRQSTSLDDYCQKIAGIPAGLGFKYQLAGFQDDFFGKTLSPQDMPTRFAVMGDLGAGSVAQRRVAVVLEAAKPQFVLLTGNIAYPHGASEDYDAHYFPVYSKALSLIAFFPAIGGLDYGDAWFRFRGQARFDSGYRKIFQRPKYYSFDAGPVHFVSLDDNEAAVVGGAEPLDLGSAQLRWLDADLAASSALWKVVFMHVPLYSTRRSDGDLARLRRLLQPIFTRRGVDVVFAGSDRVYQRSKKIVRTVYFTVGTGGAKLAKPGNGADWLDKEIVSHGLVVAEADSAQFTATFYDDGGVPKDALSIPKIRAIPPP